MTANQTLTETQIKKDLDTIDMPSDDIVFQGSGSKTAVVSYKGTLSQNDVAKFKITLRTNISTNQALVLFHQLSGKNLPKWLLGTRCGVCVDCTLYCGPV